MQNQDGTVSPKRTKGDGTIYKVNLSWKVTPDAMIYGTVSKGFRPGGINRRSTVADYAPDYLTNYEFGWKTTLAGGTLRFNGALYHQDWAKFQFSFLGPNSFTEIHNGPDATIDGLETDIVWTPTKQFSLAVSGAYTDAKTKNNLCTFDGDTQADCSGTVTTYETLYDTGSPVLTPTDHQDFIAAPKGTRLPVTPKVKLSANGRYTWDGEHKPYLQAVVAYQGSAPSDLRRAISQTFTGTIIDPNALQGELPSFTTVDLAFGAEFATWTAELYVDNLSDERAQTSRYIECGFCQQRPYAIVMPPRTVGVRIGTKF
ncbi:MAG: TonB-dependent receptor [Asticcacaulis sp.]